MKIVILGPIVNSKQSGGVGVFNEGLYEGFKRSGDQVHLISLSKSSAIDNIVVGNGNNNMNKIFFLFPAIGRLLKKIKPDVVISSVEYSMGISVYKSFNTNASFIQVLHGVAWPINGRFKAWAVNLVAKYSRKKFDYVVTVSYLSYALNLLYNGIKCDRVIHNGCELSGSKSRTQRDIDFLYVGRLFKDKQVDLISEAFKLLKEKRPDLRIAVAGYGEMEHYFLSQDFKSTGIEFLGRLSQEEVKNLFLRTKFFVSMHPMETFGTVFNEAVLNGCNIVTQTTTGVIPIYLSKPYFHSADCTNSQQLAKVLEASYLNYVVINDEELSVLREYFSYTRVANEYRNLIS